MPPKIILASCNKSLECTGSGCPQKNLLTIIYTAIYPYSIAEKTQAKWRKNMSSVGTRKFSVFHARLRCGCSQLNNDLTVNLKVSKSSICECGAKSETAFHYFLYAPFTIVLESLYLGQYIGPFHYLFQQ